MTASVVNTLESVFRTVDVHPVARAAEGEGWGNLAVIAYDRPRHPPTPDLVRNFPVHPMAVSVEESIDRTFRFPAGTPAIVLSDDYAPTDYFDAWLKEKLRKAILRDMDWDMEA